MQTGSYLSQQRQFCVWRTRRKPARRTACAVASTRVAAEFAVVNETLKLSTASLGLTNGSGIVDISAQVADVVERSGITDGVVTLSTPHTTCAIILNEAEDRLYVDILRWLERLAPRGETYLHNDIHLRFPPPAWKKSVEEWRSAEPVNAHSHLQALFLGSSLQVAVDGGALKLGTWQSILFVELDGPRDRLCHCQVLGSRPAAA